MANLCADKAIPRSWPKRSDWPGHGCCDFGHSDIDEISYTTLVLSLA